MLKDSFEKADKIFFHDRILEKTILKFFPKFIKPNHITIFRFLVTPFVIYLMATQRYTIGLLAFLLTAFTDALDGSMARTRNQITRWGRIYDPVADKILVGSMVFIIVLKYLDPLVAYLIVFIEIIIVITAWIRLRFGYKVEANIWGKIKMNLQVLGVAILLLSIIFNWADLLPFASGSLYIAIAFAIVSLLTYGI